jgi:acyl carrier protein
MHTENYELDGTGHCRICGEELAASSSRFQKAPCCDACLHVFDWFSRWLVREAGVDPDDVQLSTSLIDAHQGDSFGLVELLMELEDEFGVTISEGSEARLETLEDAIRCVRSAKPHAPRVDKRRFWARTP